MPEQVELNLANVKSITVKHPTDEKKLAIFAGFDRLLLEEDSRGVCVEGVKTDGEGRAFLFRDVRWHDLTYDLVRTDPTKAAGLFRAATPVATETSPPTPEAATAAK